MNDTAIATGRGIEKAKEWLAKLQNQDIMTVGDLRDLEDDDWAGMGLTVFACRALRNALTGRSRPSASTGNTASKPASSANGEAGLFHADAEDILIPDALDPATAQTSPSSVATAASSAALQPPMPPI